MSGSADALPVTKQREFALPLRIGVIADTHVLMSAGRTLSPRVPDLFARFRVDLIVHAGDIAIETVLETLAEVAPVIAVAGNAENGFLRWALPERVDFTVGHWRIGVTHGMHGKTARAAAVEAFNGGVDLGIFGHSHMPMIDRLHSGLMLLNPGSATDRRWSDHCGVAIVRLTEEKIDPELILFADPEHLVNIRED